MSVRSLRKVLNEREQLHLDTDIAAAGDDDDSESPITAAPSRNPFDLLGDEDDEPNAFNGDVEGEFAEQQSSHVVRHSTGVIPASNKKQKKKKKKKNIDVSTMDESEESLAAILEDLSINTSSVKRKSGVAKIKTITNKVQEDPGKHASSSILVVDPKHLKAENELRRIFGSNVVNSYENARNAGSSRQVSGGRRGAHNPRRTVLVTPSNYWPRWDGSMSMELLESKDGVHFFRYVHSPSYSYVQETFEAAKAANDINAIASILAHHPYHVESLLTFAEVFKFSGEIQSSADAIAKCLYALECAWHPLFNPLQGNCRLQYTHDTNKPLFSALFSHMKNLDRRGCHRSALEVCKLLLAIDADDPKGVLFCIDYYSLRAQEYGWLEQFSEEYKTDSSMWVFPNYSYSLAICRFYLEHNGSDSTSKTEKSPAAYLMKQALMLHPVVLQKIVDKAPLKDLAWNQILKHWFFGSAKAGSPTLEHLINIYVERNYIIWRFPELQNFLREAALMVIEILNKNNVEAKNWACVRKEAFSSDTNEYSHLLVSDFSDVIPTIPPEEVWHLMGGPGMHEGHNADENALLGRARAPREVAGRNPAIVFLESLLPWFDNGDNRNGGEDDHRENVDD